MTQDLDTLWKLHWVLVSRQGLGKWMSFMTWTKLMVHWIVSDCDLGKVSVCTPIRGCVGLHVVGIIYRCYRTCYEHASWIIRVFGKSTCP